MADKQGAPENTASGISSHGRSLPQGPLPQGRSEVPPDVNAKNGEDLMAAKAGANKSPLDWGINFAIYHARPLFFLSVLPISLELSVLYLQHSRPLDRQGLFLVGILALLANAWVLSAVTMFTFDHFADQQLKPSVFGVNLRALRCLPKIFLSYSLVAMLMVAGIMLQPLLFLVVLFVWAPCFCVGELYVPSGEKKGRQDAHYEEEDSSFPFGFDPEKMPPLTQFKDKSLMELGLLRSFNFSSANLAITVQLILLFWFINIVPLSVIDLIANGFGKLFRKAMFSESFAVLFFKVILPSYANALFCAVAAVVFIVLLPQEARAEVGMLDAESRGFVEGENRQTLKIQGRKGLLAALLAISLLSSYHFYQQSAALLAMPEGIQVAVDRIALSDTLLEMRVEMDDPQARFRWLDPKRFILTLNSGQAGATDVALKPRRVAVYQSLPKKTGEVSSGSEVTARELPLDNFAPSYQPLQFRLYFDVPLASPKGGTYVLEYELEESKQILLKGKFKPF